jgi:hypothetical protein
MINFYACPECHKKISSAFEPTESGLFIGWGCFTKEKCQFCGTSVTVNWFNYLVSVFLTLFFCYFFYLLGETLLSIMNLDYNVLTELLLFMILIPIGMLILYAGLPFTFGIIGLRFYKNKKINV